MIILYEIRDRKTHNHQYFERPMISTYVYRMIIPVLVFVSVCTAGSKKEQAFVLKPVTALDLARYKGLWYEIARLPFPYQKKCVGNTTAYYSLRDDGKINIINRCRKSDGTYAEARGIAKIEDPAGPAVLKVSFVRFLGLSLFWGDYWVIGLDKDYQWAIVGEPSRKYGWVLSRNPVIEDPTWKTIETVLIGQGYDPSQFVRTSHSSDP
jgi:apolipoprotein D and lipocalin family protein